MSISVQDDIDTLTKAWLDEGRSLPVLFPLETHEILEFGERYGFSKMQMLQVMRLIVARTPDNQQGKPN